MSIETFNAKASQKRKSARERHIEIMEMAGFSESARYFEELELEKSSDSRIAASLSSIEADIDSIQGHDSKVAIETARNFLMDADSGDLPPSLHKHPDVRLQEKVAEKRNLKDRATSAGNYLFSLARRALPVGVLSKKKLSSSVLTKANILMVPTKSGIENKGSENQTNLAPRRSSQFIESTVKTQSLRDILSSDSDEKVEATCSSHRSLWAFLAALVISLLVAYAVIVNIHPQGVKEDTKTSENHNVSKIKSLRYEAILEVVSNSGFTDPTLLNVQGSSQSKALRWISDFDPFRMHVDSDAMLQRYALATLFFATNEGVEPNDKDISVSPKSQWTYHDNWLSGKGICLWYGVKCPVRIHGGTLTSQYNENADVIGLNLTKNNIQGTIPPDLAALESLTSVDFSSNQIEGEFPAFLVEFEFLEKIELQRNSLEGTIPSSINQCKNLLSFDVSRNTFEGYVPSSMSTMDKLQELSVRGNLLLGNLPDFGDLTKLSFLDLSENQFRGTIPNSYGDMSNLIQLHFHQNNLVGSVPDSLCKLTRNSSLKVLTADCNKDVECHCCHECFPREE